MNNRKEQKLYVKQETYGAFSGFNVLINILLGTGPIFVPPVFIQGGYIASSIVLFVMCFICYITAEMVMEAVSISNGVKTQLEENKDFLSKEKYDSKYQFGFDIFKTIKTYELGEMMQIFINKFFNIITSLAVAVYLMGVCISKFISSSIILSDTFHRMDNAPIVDSYYFWLSLMFSISAIFSFSNVQKTKILQNTVTIVRICTIASLIIGALYIVNKNGNKGLTTDKYKEINLENLGNLVSNTMFAFICHHSLPSVLAPVKPEIAIKRINFIVFSSSFLMILCICLTGIMAFGNDLVGVNELKYYNLNFYNDCKITYYLSSFYMFLNIAALPVLIIVIRNNIMKALVPRWVPVKSQQLTIHTVSITILILVPIILVPLYTQNIQIVLDITGGVLGVFLMMIIPCVLLIYGRKKCNKNQIIYRNNKHMMSGRWVCFAYLILLISFFALGYNVNNLIINTLLDKIE